MAKKIKAIVTLQIPAGKANPAPPIGPAPVRHQPSDQAKQAPGDPVPALEFRGQAVHRVRSCGAEVSESPGARGSGNTRPNG